MNLVRQLSFTDTFGQPDTAIGCFALLEAYAGPPAHMACLPDGLAARRARAEQILGAAEMLLIRPGYQRITMEEVAQQSRVGTGTIYLADQPRDPAEAVIAPIGDLHRGSLRALKCAPRMSRDVRAVKVVSSPEDSVALGERWAAWEHVVGDARLICLSTDYRDILDPLVDYIRGVHERECRGQLLTVVLPEFVPESRLSHLLHNQTALLLRALLRTIEDVVVIDVPYHLRRQAVPVAKAEREDEA